MKKYDTYKPSGVEWLGEIPEHWEIRKLKYLGNIYAGINGKKGDDFDKEYKEGFKSFIPFTNICNNIVIDNKQYQYVKVNENENQSRVKKNDILFLMSSETLDDIAKNSIYLDEDNELYLNSFCKGFRIKKSNIYPLFLNYLLSSKTYRNYFSLVGRGFTRVNLKQEYINDAFAILPDFQEQTAIANFLDDKTTKIDQAIAIKEQQIGLLKERKQIIIQEVVTGKKVLNPEKNAWTEPVEVKDSGVEWIGEIPEHWEVKKLKYLTNYFKGFAFSSVDFAEEGIPIVKASNIKKWTIENITSFISFDNQKSKFENFKLNEGDIIISTVGSKPEIGESAVGQLAIINDEFSQSYLNQNTVCIRPISISTYKYFLKYVFISSYMRSNFDKISLWIANQAYIEIDSIMEIFIALPPKSEQIVISEYIETTASKITKAISLKVQEIEKLKEYKVSLIDGVVTGKVRVC